MKIALITYHFSNNKGALMQTYALCKYLKGRGHYVEIIDVRQEEPAGQSFLAKYVRNAIWYFRMHKIVSGYYPPLTRKYGSLNDLQNDPPLADCYMVGSDQVWNPEISKSLALAYFLDFGAEKIKRVSYASSFGTSKWTINDSIMNSRIKYLLSRFNSLSVRESEGQKIANDFFDINIQQVLDPTFLNNDYKEFGDVYTGNEIVCYKLNQTNDFWDNIRRVSDAMRLPILLLNHTYPKRGIKYCFPPSLKTWMQKMASAAFIVTDSFHGLAFSIINRKQFAITLNHNGKDSRLTNLITLLGLEDRMFDSMEELVNNKPWEKNIEYKNIEPLLNRLIKQSRDYLDNSLS